MAQTESGNYYYVESNSLNDELTNFAVYEDSNNDLVFHDQSNSEEPKYVAGSGFDVPSSRGYQVNGTQVVGSQSSAYTTANVTTDRDLDADADAVAAVADVLGTLISDLQTHGLIG